MYIKETPMLTGYSKIYRLEHTELDGWRAEKIDHFFYQEKFDGSQFSFGIQDGDLLCRSKGQPLTLENTNKQFAASVEHVKEIQHLLEEGWVYRGEAFSGKKHNHINYGRKPNNHIVLFDVDKGKQSYVAYPELAEIAEKLEIEAAPIVHEGPMLNLEEMKNLLAKTPSMLGGDFGIEGVVIKTAPDKIAFDRGGKVLMGKIVRDDFKETMQPKNKNRKGKKSVADTAAYIGKSFATEARWEKAVQKLKDDGDYTRSPMDIGKLLKIVKDDVKEEEIDAIKQQLWLAFEADVLKGSTKGLPEWYKSSLPWRAEDESRDQ